MSYICAYCGKDHEPEQCPRIKAIEYYEDGQIKRVEFYDKEYPGIEEMLKRYQNINPLRERVP